MKNKSKCMISVVIMVLVLGSYLAYRNQVSETIGTSTEYSEKEIRSAIKLVKKNFASEMSTASLKKITYNEAESQAIIKTYVPTLAEFTSLKAHAKLIVLNTEFHTRSNSGSLEPNSRYQDYYWILVENQKEGGWEIFNVGFLN